MTAPASGGVRDRRVLLLLVACVVAILGLNVLSGLIPELDRFLAQGPILVIVLVVGTAVVLALSVGRHRRG